LPFPGIEAMTGGGIVPLIPKSPLMVSYLSRQRKTIVALLKKLILSGA